MDRTTARRAFVPSLEIRGTRNNALAWLLAQKPWIVPIPGTTKLARVEENIGAAAIELTPNHLCEIDNAAAKITVRGARYPEQLQRQTYR